MTNSLKTTCVCLVILTVFVVFSMPTVYANDVTNRVLSTNDEEVFVKVDSLKFEKIESGKIMVSGFLTHVSKDRKTNDERFQFSFAWTAFYKILSGEISENMIFPFWPKQMEFYQSLMKIIKESPSIREDIIKQTGLDFI